jgi:hypothetical protein
MKKFVLISGLAITMSFFLNSIAAAAPDLQQSILDSCNQILDTNSQLLEIMKRLDYWIRFMMIAGIAILGLKFVRGYRV